MRSLTRGLTRSAAPLLVVAVVALVVGTSRCSKSTTTPTTTTTTTTPATTSSTTSTTTSTTTTTSAPATATPSVSVQNGPCVAPASGQVSCTFSGSATGATAPYTFNWLFTNPANGQTAAASGAQVRPDLGCSLSTGVVTFNVSVRLTATPATGTAGSVTVTQAVTRAAGACGT